LSLLVLWPRDLRFTYDARELYARVYPADVADAQLRVAFAIRDQYAANKRVIDRLELAFEAAIIALGLQTLSWTLALA